jgi:predicted hydrocarbon binding protein
MVDSYILILAAVSASEGVRAFLGDNGAKAIFRDAGRQSGQKLLENQMEESLSVLDKEEALRRACMALKELGFAKSITKEDGNIVIEEDIFTNAIAIMGGNLSDSPIIYFLAGLIEGFVSFMSNQKVTLVPEVVEKGKIVYRYS